VTPIPEKKQFPRSESSIPSQCDSGWDASEKAKTEFERWEQWADVASEVSQMMEIERDIPSPDFVGDESNTQVGGWQSSEEIQVLENPVEHPDWPDPQQIDDRLLPVIPFPIEVVPEIVRRYCIDVGRRVAVPVDFPAAAIYVSISAVIGRQLVLRPEGHSRWQVFPNIWGGIVGRPGVRKSPVINGVTKFVWTLEDEAREIFSEASRTYKAELEVFEADKRDAQKSIQKNIRTEPELAKQTARELMTGEPEEPHARRYITSDPTPEAIETILQHSPNGLLLYRDELVGFLQGLEKQGREGSRKLYLEAWSGDGNFTSDRIQRGTTHLRGMCISILGSIQPEPLRALLVDAGKRDGNKADGLLERFQFLVYPDIGMVPSTVIHQPDVEAERELERIFQKLANLDFSACGASIPSEDSLQPYLIFTEDAQTAFMEYQAEYRRRALTEQYDSTLAGYYDKLPGFLASLALITHLLDGCQGPVSKETLNRSVVLVEYSISHFKRAIAPVSAPEFKAASHLAKKITEGRLGRVGFSLRDVYCNKWRGLGTAAEARAACEELRQAGYIRPIKESRRGGRPSERFEINPKVWR